MACKSLRIISSVPQFDNSKKWWHPIVYPISSPSHTNTMTSSWLLSAKIVVAAGIWEQETHPLAPFSGHFFMSTESDQKILFELDCFWEMSLFVCLFVCVGVWVGGRVPCTIRCAVTVIEAFQWSAHSAVLARVAAVITVAIQCKAFYCDVEQDLDWARARERHAGDLPSVRARVSGLCWSVGQQFNFCVLFKTVMV